jgi:nucleoside-diphosphate-sugar epimerase
MSIHDRTVSLVTGGAGFLGSHLCKQLLARRLQPSATPLPAEVIAA